MCLRMGSVFRYSVICLVFSLVLQILIQIPSVKCGKKDGLSEKWELFKLLMDIHNLPSKFIKGLRDKPLLQLMNLVNDYVEPIVTAAEVLLVLDDLKKKFEEKYKNEESKEIKEESKEPVMVFSGENKLQMNQYLNELEPKNMFAFNELEQNLYPKHKEYVKSRPESPKIRLSKKPKLMAGSEPLMRMYPKYNGMDLLLNTPPFNYHFNRILVNNIPMNYRTEFPSEMPKLIKVLKIK